MSEQGKSIEQLEAEIEATRARLARTVDELTFRASPQELVRRQKESLALSFHAATRDEHGELRTDRIAAVLGAVALVLIGMGLLRRRRG
jgi:hypothetical protein